MDENTKLIRIGYWRDRFGGDLQYPDPHDFMDEEFYKINHEIGTMLNRHLTYAKSCNYFRGYDSCRVCGERLGTHEFSDGVYIWPEALEHYVNDHNVRLPAAFIQHVMETTGKECDWFKNIDETFWLDWGKKLYP